MDCKETSAPAAGLGPRGQLAEVHAATKTESERHRNRREHAVKTKDEFKDLIAKIASKDNPVGMDVVYVHALILDKLIQIEERLDTMARRLDAQK